MGSYRIRVYDPTRRFASQWAYGADSYDTADLIAAGVGLGTVVDVALLDAGAIVGTVSDAVTGEPLYACVEVLAVGSENFAAYECTDDSGRYRAVVADPGDYHVRFTAEFYVSEWANDRATREQADVITVSAAQDTRLDALLTPLGQITGQVTDLTGNPLAYISVQAFGIDDPSGFGFAETAFDGVYRIRGLPAGRYHVLFTEHSFGNYASEWWSDSPDRAHADPVRVALAGETANIDAALGPSGYIAGTVTDAATGQPLAEVCPRAVHAASGEAVEGSSPSCTGIDGRYEINAVGGSSYKVQFQPTDSAYVTQWYRNKPSQKSANRVRVEYGQRVDKIDAALRRAG
jgi:Carboxypeptidase regulatory-like domain